MLVAPAPPEIEDLLLPDRQAGGAGQALGLPGPGRQQQLLRAEGGKLLWAAPVAGPGQAGQAAQAHPAGGCVVLQQNKRVY